MDGPPWQDWAALVTGDGTRAQAAKTPNPLSHKGKGAARNIERIVRSRVARGGTFGSGHSVPADHEGEQSVSRSCSARVWDTRRAARHAGPRWEGAPPVTDLDSQEGHGSHVELHEQHMQLSENTVRWAIVITAILTLISTVLIALTVLFM